MYTFLFLNMSKFQWPSELKYTLKSGLVTKKEIWIYDLEHIPDMP